MPNLIKLLACLMLTFSHSSLAEDWQAVASLNTARSHFAAGVIGNKIYIFGGHDVNDAPVNSTEVLNLTQPSAWTLLPGTTNDRVNSVIEYPGAALNEQFYVFGGYYGVEYNVSSNFVEAYNPVTDSWASKQSMPTNRYLAVAAAHANEIYVFGGEYAQSDISKTYYYKLVEAFDPVTDSWRSVTNLPQLRLLPSVAIVNNNAYVVGGGQIKPWKVFGDLFAYDFALNSWTKSGLTKLPTPRVFAYGHAAPVIDGKIYLIGGATTGKKPNLIPSKKVEIYDPASNTWQIGPDLPQAAMYGAAVAVGNELYVVGGQTDNLESSVVDKVWKLTAPWKASLSALETCDLNADGKFTSIDANLFSKACKTGTAYWQCDLNSDGLSGDAKDLKIYKTQWKKGSRSCKDGILYQASITQTSNLQVEGQGKVSKILADDTVGDRHQRFILRLNTGQTLLVAHNINIAPRISNLKTGDTVSFYGEYEWNDQGGVLHWTHHDPDNQHIDGWLRHAGNIYQ
jgi:N-acetylneuraminic acid mutarotase